MPQAHTLLRLVLAILVSIGHIVLLQRAAPCRQPSTAFTALAASVMLLCTTLNVAMLHAWLHAHASRACALTESRHVHFA